ncbi:MAG TPA: 4-hydroxy-tetrahydrodipicolinate synthase [Actinomycetales bacterium]|nr:4-hydroxy-tetrahydrodipicolinate synthase [Actinomycetales bacterium]
MPDAPHRPFGAVLTAMVTPFDTGGALDLDGAAALATHLVDAGNDGLVVSGTTGESPTTSDAEQDQLLRAVLDAVGGRARVVAGVGTNDTAHTLELARAAEKAGAHGLLVVTPYYSKPPQEGLVAHFTAAADATDLPVILYDIPARSGTAIATDTLVRLASHERIVAVKDAKDDLFASAEVMAATDLAYYSGTDDLNLAHLCQGAAGLISVVSHATSPHYAEMVRCVDADDLAGARDVHRRLLPVVRAIMRTTQGAIMAKAAAQLSGVIAHRTVRPPLVDATDEQVAILRAALAETGDS